MNARVRTCPGCGARVVISPCRFCGSDVPAPQWPADDDDRPEPVTGPPTQDTDAERSDGLVPTADIELATPVTPEPAPQPPLPFESAPALPRPGRTWLLVAAAVLGLAVLGVVVGLLTGDRPTPRPTVTVVVTPTGGLGTASPGTLVTAAPQGTWLLILESMPKDSVTLEQAQAKARDLSVSPRHVLVLDSDQIPGLHGGYWALADAGYDSADSARAACGHFGRDPGGRCYAREVG